MRAIRALVVLALLATASNTEAGIAIPQPDPGAPGFWDDLPFAVSRRLATFLAAESRAVDAFTRAMNAAGSEPGTLSVDVVATRLGCDTRGPLATATLERAGLCRADARHETIAELAAALDRSIADSGREATNLEGPLFAWIRQQREDPTRAGAESATMDALDAAFRELPDENALIRAFILAWIADAPDGWDRDPDPLEAGYIRVRAAGGDGLPWTVDDASLDDVPRQQGVIRLLVRAWPDAPLDELPLPMVVHLEGRGCAASGATFVRSTPGGDWDALTGDIGRLQAFLGSSARPRVADLSDR